MEDSFIYIILEIVAEIPSGNVASYSQIAALAGYPKNARKVGNVLSKSQSYGQYPCHRVLRQDGQLVEGWKEQRSLLQEEGVVFLKNGRVDMKECHWFI